MTYPREAIVYPSPSDFTPMLINCQTCSYTFSSRAGISTQACPKCSAEYVWHTGVFHQVKEGNLSRVMTYQVIPTLITEHTDQVRFATQVLAATRQRFTNFCPLTGTLEAITVQWPPGCAALVDVEAGTEGLRLVGPIAMDTVTPVPFPQNRACKVNERFYTVVDNGDAVNPHSPIIVFMLRGV